MLFRETCQEGSGDGLPRRARNSEGGQPAHTRGNGPSFTSRISARARPLRVYGRTLVRVVAKVRIEEISPLVEIRGIAVVQAHQQLLLRCPNAKEFACPSSMI